MQNLVSLNVGVGEESAGYALASGMVCDLTSLHISACLLGVSSLHFCQNLSVHLSTLNTGAFP